MRNSKCNLRFSMCGVVLLRLRRRAVIVCAGVDVIGHEWQRLTRYALYHARLPSPHSCWLARRQMPASTRCSHRSAHTAMATAQQLAPPLPSSCCSVVPHAVPQAQSRTHPPVQQPLLGAALLCR
jgi:hypothetical protein